VTAAAWFRRAVQAADLVGGRAELWLPGAIAALVYLGWVPLVAAVAQVPQTSEVVFFGTRLASSALFPLNVVLISAAVVLLVLLACAGAAFGEAAIQRAIALRPPGPRLRDDVAAIYGIVLLAALPVGIALAALAFGLAAVAPDVVTTPDIGGTLAVRMVTALAPYLAALGVVLIVGQALGAAAMRRATGPEPMRISAALAAGLGDLVRRPARRLGIAAAATLIDLTFLAVSLVGLRMLWDPIRADLAAGRLTSPVTLVLIVGFVTVWLITVLAAGAIHSWGTAWWSLELLQGDGEAMP